VEPNDFRDLHLKDGDIDVVIGDRDGRMLGGRARPRPVKSTRREPVDRHARRQPARLNTDHLPIGRSRGCVVRFRGEQLRATGREPRFCLRHVGARNLASAETVARLPQRRFEHIDVAALKLEHRGIAQQIHVGRDRAQKNSLLGAAQRFARRKHLRLRLPRAVAGLEAVEQRLRAGGTKGRDRILTRSPGRAARRPGDVFEIDLGQAAGRGQARSIAAKRNGNVLIGRARRSSLSIELGIVLVGLHQSLLKRVCAGGQACQQKHRHCGARSQSKEIPTPALQH